MNHLAAEEFLKTKTKQELLDAYRDEYLEWEKSGVLIDGLIRDLYNIISEGASYISLISAQDMFMRRLAELFYLENQLPR